MVDDQRSGVTRKRSYKADGAKPPCRPEPDVFVGLRTVCRAEKYESEGTETSVGRLQTVEGDGPLNRSKEDGFVPVNVPVWREASFLGQGPGGIHGHSPPFYVLPSRAHVACGWTCWPLRLRPVRWGKTDTPGRFESTRLSYVVEQARRRWRVP